MKTRHKKLTIILAGLAALGVASALVLNAFQNNLVFFYTPTQVATGEAPTSSTFRLGGMVEEGSVRRQGLKVSFVVSDMNEKIAVDYDESAGMLPDLFREGQGVVAQGKLLDGKRFAAQQVLAKHDEKYMPPEVASAMKQQVDAKEAQGYTPAKP